MRDNKSLLLLGQWETLNLKIPFLFKEMGFLSQGLQQSNASLSIIRGPRTTLTLRSSGSKGLTNVFSRSSAWYTVRRRTCSQQSSCCSFWAAQCQNVRNQLLGTTSKTLYTSEVCNVQPTQQDTAALTSNLFSVQVTQWPKWNFAKRRIIQKKPLLQEKGQSVSVNAPHITSRTVLH